MTKRVVITGMGLISPLGSSVKSAFERFHKFENCIEYLPELDVFENLNTRLGAKVKDFRLPDYFNRKITRTMDDVGLYSVVSAIDAVTDAGLLNDEILSGGQTGVSYGSSTGSLNAFMDFYAMMVNHHVKSITSGSYIKMMSQTASVNISLYFKTKGRLVPTSTACTSGSMGIGSAYELIKNGIQTVMIAGGAEAFNPTQVGVFDSLYATSSKNDTPQKTPAPFDKDRDGLVIGEGAGTVVLEEYEHAKARGAKIYAEVAGFATNTDGTHITNPNCETMAIVMEDALKSANIDKNQIGYINAHGTGTRSGDCAESTATNKVFGNSCPISSIKSYTGHTLGACGAIEAILSVEMMNNKWFCPNLNLVNVDENCADLDYIKNSERIIDTEFVMSNNFAFGGINTSLIFKRI